LHEEFRGVDPGEGLNDFAGKAFAFEAGPGPGGVDALEMAATVKLAGEFEVMEDPKDRLNDSHSTPRGDSPRLIVTKGL
jgi:hypothetical protein